MRFILWESDGTKTEGELPDEEPCNLLELTKEDQNTRLGFDLHEVLSQVQATGASCVTLLGANSHVALLLSFDNASDAVLRVPSPLGPGSADYKRLKLSREAQILQWISTRTDIPVPKIVQDATDAPIPFMVTTKCVGGSLARGFGVLSEAAQIENLRSYVDIALQMFRLDCPQVIGSLEKLTPLAPDSEEHITVGPSIHGNYGYDSATTFSSIARYFAWLFMAKKKQLNISSWADEDRAQAARFWDNLEHVVSDEISKLPSSLLRVVPVHQDFVAHNVLIRENGQISGVYDWEFHGMLPAVLAADYPSWIRYSGHDDPRFTRTNGNFSHFWFASPEDAARLRAEYDAIVKVLDQEYYAALRQGGLLRDIYGWMIVDQPDIGCRIMQEWLDSVTV